MLENPGDVKGAVVEIVHTSNEIVSASEVLDNFLRPGRRFYPATRLLGLLRAIVSSGNSTEINHPSLKPLNVFPIGEWFQYSGELNNSIELFQTPFYELTINPLNNLKKPKETQEWTPQPLWTLSYAAAYFGSEGRLLQSCSPTDWLQLTATPDFSMIPHTNEHKELAAYLIRYKTDIQTIARETQISLSTIIDFTNACQEIRLLKRMNPGSKTLKTDCAEDVSATAPQANTKNIRFPWFKSTFTRFVSKPK